MSLIGALVIWAIEDGEKEYIDCLILSVTAFCVNGLVTLDLAGLKTGTNVFVIIWTMLGSGVLASIAPLVIRLYYVKHSIKKDPRIYIIRNGCKVTDPELVLIGNSRLEYIGTKFMIYIVLGYYFGTQLLGILVLWIYFGASPWAYDQVSSQGVNPYWFAFFEPITAFCNNGLSLVSNSLISMKSSAGLLIVLAFEVLWGNTAFPLFMRLIVWICSKIRPNNVVLTYLLQHPRRVFSHLFPHYQTIWLLIVLITTNVIQWVFFLGLEWHGPILQGFSDSEKVINGFFQSISTRTAGFNTVDLSLSHPAMNVLYLGMMYLAVYPVTAFIRSSAASEKKSTQAEKSGKNKKTEDSTVELSPRDATPPEGRKLHSVHVVHRYQTRPSTKSPPQGLHVHKSSDFFSGATRKEKDVSEEDVYKPPSIRSKSKLGYQIQTLLYRDITWVFLSLFIVCCIEGERISSDSNFTIFKILFEIVSAYGTVGLSLGYPNVTTSFCSVWTTGSKVIICIVMVMGRHRGLPESIDPSVRLPSIPELAMARRAHRKKLKVTVMSPKASNSEVGSNSSSDDELKNEGDVIIDMDDLKSSTVSESETTTTRASKEPISLSTDFAPMPIIRKLRRHASLDSMSLPSAKRRSKDKERPKEPIPFELKKRLSTLSLASNHTVRSDLGFDMDFLEHDVDSSEDFRWTRRAYSLDDADRVEYN